MYSMHISFICSMYLYLYLHLHPVRVHFPSTLYLYSLLVPCICTFTLYMYHILVPLTYNLYFYPVNEPYIPTYMYHVPCIYTLSPCPSSISIIPISNPYRISLSVIPNYSPYPSYLSPILICNLYLYLSPSWCCAELFRQVPVQCVPLRQVG